jgi:membrane fusion protein (multidrug efflux system)
MNRNTWKTLVAAGLFASLGVVGCKPHAAPPPPPVPEVAVLTVQPQRVVLTSELLGRTAGYLVAEIRPQVNGLLKKRVFVEGAKVKAGDLLYQIDPAPYEAALESANATLISAREGADRAEAALKASIASLKRHEAVLKLAKANYRRYEKLVKTQAASEMQRDQSGADVEVADSGLQVAKAQVVSDREAVNVARAAIKQAEAAVKTAEINLAYTKITAPITGRIGRSHVTEGAIVTAYQPAALATIQQFDPIYVDVPQSTTELNRLRRSLASGELKDDGVDEVTILLEDDTEYPLKGSLKAREVTVDPTTGSVILRIVAPNPDQVLLPGMFVRAIIDDGVNEQAILVPQQAVSRDPKGNPTALVVGDGDKVEYRHLTTSRAVGNQWLVTAGLKPGDRLIVEGMQKTRPGSQVKVVPFEPNRTDSKKPTQTARAATPLN